MAEKLGLPGNTFEQTTTYCDKNKFRCLCEKVGVPVPAHIEIKDNTIPNFSASLPWIVKPSDSQSSNGISKIDSIEEFPAAVEYALSKSKRHKAILEQYFVGEEVVCEGFIYQGKYRNIFFGDRRYFRGTLIPSQTLFPSLLDVSIKKQILECEKAIAKEINPSFGIVHSEYLVNKESGKFCIVESAIRGGGVYISSHLVPLATGIDINNLLLKCALGEGSKEMVEAVFASRYDKASAYVCFTLPEGTITGINGLDKIMEIDGVQLCDIRDLSVGEKTHKMTAKGMRKGPIIIEAKDRSELDLIIEKLKRSLSVVVSTDKYNSVIWS